MNINDYKNQNCECDKPQGAKPRFLTHRVSEAEAGTKLVEIIRENFDLRPAGIIKMLDLRRPIYRQTAAYGHFGRTDVDLPWEHLDKVDDLKKYLA